MTGLLLEGIVSSGKTSVLHELHTHDAWSGRTAKLVLSDFFTDRANEHLRSRTQSSYAALMRQNLKALQALHHIELSTPLLKSGTSRDLCFLLERFHLSHAVRYADGDLKVYGDIDRELASFGCRIVVLTIENMFIGPRITELFRLRGPRWQMYQQRLETRVGDLNTHFARVQEKLIACAEASAMKHAIIDTTDRDWSRCVEEIITFWGI